jgi:tetratricopeptide (TPR) repeat protein
VCTAQSLDASTIAPARANLAPVPTPRLDGLDAPVVDQLREAELTVVRAATGNASSRTLAAAYGSLARVYHAYEFFDSAEPAYVNASRLADSDARWPHLLGYLYQQTGRLEEAAASLLAVRRISPGDLTVAVRLGDVYLGLNRLRAARDEFERVIDTFPAVARRGLGEVALREARFSDAVDLFRAVLDRVPQATSVHYSLAMAYRGLGRMDDARAQLERRGANEVRVADPDVDSLPSLLRGEHALVMQGRRLYDAGQFQEAADVFRKALAAAPSSVAAHVNLGSTLVRLGKIQDAIGEFEAALARDAGNPTAHGGLGLLLVGQHRDREALPHLQAAFTSASDDAGVTAVLVGVLVRLERPGEAIDVLTTSRSSRPDDEASTVALSILLADRGRFRDAIALLDEANAAFPERTTTATTLARLLASSPDASLRNGRRALDLATAVSQAEPSPVHTETIAIALAELGRCAEARDVMRRAVSEADRAKDAAEAARLKGEMKKYESASCRP